MVLEWEPIQLATADLISLSLYRNGQKAGNIPNPKAMHSTKISGLAVDTEYAFHLVLRTTAGTFASERVVVRTHKMTDLSGITITTGILPTHVRENLLRAVERIGAKVVDGVRIDTTHFVTTEGRGVQWERANELNIPVVRPEWVDACEKNGRILGVTKFYLDAIRPSPVVDERPGTAGSATAIPVQQHQHQHQQEHQQHAQKDLPPVPINGRSSGPGDEEAARRKEGSGSEDQDDSDESEDDEQEEKSRSGGGHEDEKIRADEREQRGLAVRPRQPTVEDDESDSKDDMSGGRGDNGGGKSPGDGASFQDVAL